MKTLVIGDRTFRRSIPYRTIRKRVKKLADILNDRWVNTGETPLIVSVLNGAFMFTAELFRHLRFDCEVSFVKLSSYKGLSTGGEVYELIGLSQSLEGRQVIVLEDIVETGHTIETVDGLLRCGKPAGITYVCLFFKPAAYTKSIRIDHYAFELPNDFVVGFGLDYDEKGRALKDIYTLIER